MRNFTKHLSLILFSIMIIIFVNQSVFAYDALPPEACEGSAAQSAVCIDSKKTDNPITGKNGILYKVSMFISFLAGAIAVIMIIYASFLFVSSGGNTEKAAKARRTIIYVCIGLIVIVFAAQLVAFVASKVT